MWKITVRLILLQWVRIGVDQPMKLGIRTRNKASDLIGNISNAFSHGSWNIPKWSRSWYRAPWKEILVYHHENKDDSADRNTANFYFTKNETHLSNFQNTHSGDRGFAFNKNKRWLIKIERWFIKIKRWLLKKIRMNESKCFFTW